MARKIFEGTIVSLKMPKTAVVEIETMKIDKRYKKRHKSDKKYMSHYDGLELKLGDRVKISDSRPYSKNKKWIVESIVNKTK